MIAPSCCAGRSWCIRDRRRRASNLVAPPLGVTLMKVAVMAVAGVVVVLIGNTNRGVGVIPCRACPGWS